MRRRPRPPPRRRAAVAPTPAASRRRCRRRRRRLTFAAAASRLTRRRRSRRTRRRRSRRTRRRPAGYVRRPARSTRSRRSGYAAAPAAVGARLQRRRRGARRHARDGGADDLPRRRHRARATSRTRRQVDARPGHGDAVRGHRPRGASRSSRSSPPRSTSATRRPPTRRGRPRGKESKAFTWKSRGAAPDVIVFGGLIVGFSLAYMGLKRRGKSSANFIIGSDADADAPVSPDFVPSPSHPLVAATGGDYVVNVTPRMTGEVFVDNQLYPAAAVHPAARLQLLAAAERPRQARLRRDHVPGRRRRRARARCRCRT